MSADDQGERQARREKRQQRLNRSMLAKLLVFVCVMGSFGYAMVPMYKTICEVLGVNVVARGDADAAGYRGKGAPVNSQVDLARSVTVEFDANARGPWDFRPETARVEVHPGEVVTVMYEFRNRQDRTMAAQAFPSYAPQTAAPHFRKLECFCFTEHVLKPGEAKRWPVVFVVDRKLPKDVRTITLSYTFFEVGGRTPVEPARSAARTTVPGAKAS